MKILNYLPYTPNIDFKFKLQEEEKNKKRFSLCVRDCTINQPIT